MLLYKQQNAKDYYSLYSYKCNGNFILIVLKACCIPRWCTQQPQRKHKKTQRRDQASSFKQASFTPSKIQRSRTQQPLAYRRPSKLIRWRIVTHGGIDGYSRIPVYLGPGDNNRAETVLRLFLEAVQKYGLPSRVRA